MPISVLLLYGSMGGLAGVLVSTIILPFLGAGTAMTPLQTAASSLSLREVLLAVLHVFAGAGIAALYWLSWGFAALVEIPWWLRGLAFGAACWTVLVMPALATAALGLKVRLPAFARLAFEWGCTCLFAALACAWSWGT